MFLNLSANIWNMSAPLGSRGAALFHHCLRFAIISYKILLYYLGISKKLRRKKKKNFQILFEPYSSGTLRLSNALFGMKNG